MRSSTLQFVVAGALVAAWAWMLGRPLLTNLFRRSRRDSVGHFRYQQAVLSQPAGYERQRTSGWAERPRPIRAWRSQPLERRRLQTMLGFALATFFSLLLAIALRGIFVRLLLVMVSCFVAYVCVAAYIGSRQLRRIEAGTRRRAAAEHRAQTRAESEQVVQARPERSVLFPDPLPEIEDEEIDQRAETLQGAAEFDSYEGFGTGEFDEDFFEPIPGLTFEPLNLDSSILQHGDDSGTARLFGPGPERDARESALGFGSGSDMDSDSNMDFAASFASDLDDAFDFDLDHDFDFAFGADAPIGTEVEVEVDVDVAAEGEVGFGVDSDVDADVAPMSTPTFTASPLQRQRPAKRNKARPIYIESQLDEDDEQIKAVND